MSAWQIKITREAETDFSCLDSLIQNRVTRKIYWLRDNFENVIPMPLSEAWRDYFKLRVGDWRIIYQPDYSLKSLIIYRIERRDKIYKI